MQKIKLSPAPERFSLLATLCKANGIHLTRYSEAAELLDELGISEQVRHSSGFAAQIDDLTYIFYDETKPLIERGYIVTHELAHILLGHLSGDTGLSTNYMEVEANTLASALVAQMLYEEYKKSDTQEQCFI